MSLLSKLVTVLVFVATLLLLPKLGSYSFGFLLRTYGWSIQRRTKDRTEAILARVRADREDFDSKQVNKTSRSSEDEEWEKVDNAASGTPTKGKAAEDNWDGIIGFFHPFWYAMMILKGACLVTYSCDSNAGGGGERVLWEAVHATQKRWPRATCVIYTGDHEVGKTEMLERVKVSIWIQLMHDVSLTDCCHSEPFQHPALPSNSRVTLSLDA
jgi:hypothetical protein